MVGPSNTYFDTSADHSKTFKRDLHLQWEIYNNAIDFTYVFCNAEIDIYTLFHVKTRPRATFQSCGGVKTTIALKCRQKYKKDSISFSPFMFCGFAISIMLLSWPRAVKFYFISVKPS